MSHTGSSGSTRADGCDCQQNRARPSCLSDRWLLFSALSTLGFVDPFLLRTLCRLEWQSLDGRRGVRSLTDRRRSVSFHGTTHYQDSLLIPQEPVLGKPVQFETTLAEATQE